MQNIITTYKGELQNVSVVSTIVFISDLHFDYMNKKSCIECAEEIKNTFISYIKEKYSRSIVCIGGDCFDDWQKALTFIQELEQERINGFIVLGNHDYWNDGTKTYKELLHIFAAETKENKYFRLLMTGRKYYIGDVCFIGDTGWTSFILNKRHVNLSQFMELPEATLVKDFSPKEIVSMHNCWIKFANSILEQEKKVIILTHYPMVCYAKEPKDTWWSSKTKLIESKKCWKIFGHTHKNKQRKRNNISAQRGYGNRDMEELRKYQELSHIGQYGDDDFGLLIKTEETTKLQTLDLTPLIDFYSPTVVENSETQIELVKEIKGRGFKRSSMNWRILAELALDPYGYIEYIKKLMKNYEKSAYIGYRYNFELSEKTVYAIHTAIASLERIFDSNDFSNPMIFVMAAIVTGYVYNEMPYGIESMRPVDYYDIVRFYLVFQTMKKYNLRFEDISSIRKHKSRTVVLKNVPVGLPTLNKQCMTIEEAYECLKGTPLLTETNVIE